MRKKSVRTIQYRVLRYTHLLRIKKYFIYRRAKHLALHPVDGRGPMIATVDGECSPNDAVTVDVCPLAGNILLPKPAYERFAAERKAVSVQ